MRKKMTLFGTLALALSTCAGPTHSPESVVEYFMRRVEQMDFTGAANLATEEGKVHLQSFLEVWATIPQDQLRLIETKRTEAATKTFTIVKTEIDGDVGRVAFRFGEIQHTLNVRRVQGQWLVDFRKGL